MRELFRTQCLTSIFAQALGTYHTDEINLPRNPITFALSHYHLSGYAVLPLDSDYFSGTGIGKVHFMRYLMDDIEVYIARWSCCSDQGLSRAGRHRGQSILLLCPLRLRHLPLGRSGMSTLHGAELPAE